jgi:hypothetical protein
MADYGVKKPLPKKLAEDLKSAPRFRPNGRPGTSPSSKKNPLKNVMNHNVEQAMFDEILGPLVNHNGNRRPVTNSSPIRSPSSNKGGAGGLLRPGSASKKNNAGAEKNDGGDLGGILKGALAFKENEVVTSEKSVGSGKSLSAAGAHANSASAAVNNDSSFTNSILARLSSVEKDNKDLRKQLATAAAKMDNLEHDNKKLTLMLEDKDEEEYRRMKQERQRGGEEGGSAAVPRASSINQQQQQLGQGVKLLEENRELKEYSADLEEQLAEMEKFLADYGLVWVGADNNSNSNSNKRGGGDAKGEGGSSRSDASMATDKKVYRLGGKSGESSSITEEEEETAAKVQHAADSKEDEPEPPTPIVPGVEYAAFAKKIKELNEIIYSEPAMIKKEKFNEKQARLMQPSEYYDSVPVTLYRDGILVKRGPFRENGSPGYDSFVRDIMEGYFPTDFRQEYPDGVILELKDRHHDLYGSKSSSSAAEGLALKGGSNILGNSVSMSKDALLSRLPVSSVSAAGEVNDVRASIGKMLDPASGVDTKGEPVRREDREVARQARLARLGSHHDSQPKENVPHTNAARTGTDAGVRGSSSGSHNDSSDRERNDPPPSYHLSNLMSSPGYRGSNKNGSSSDISSRKEKSTEDAKTVGSGIINVDTPAVASGDVSNTALVKVKWLDGTTLSVRLFNDELVGDLKEHVKRHFYNNSADSCPSFEVRAAYPPRALQGRLTLQEAGLVPNGIVHAMAVA